MQWTQASAEKRLTELKVGDMPIIAVQPKKTYIDKDWFPKYKQECRNFVRSLTDSVEELAMMNLGRNEFMDLLMGREIPDNLSIRFRIPLIWGGELSADNMFMCFTFPHSQIFDRFIIEQTGNETIWLPNPARKIYLPIHSTIARMGGNGVPDRLNQISATVMASRRQSSQG